MRFKIILHRILFVPFFSPHFLLFFVFPLSSPLIVSLILQSSWVLLILFSADWFVIVIACSLLIFIEGPKPVTCQYYYMAYPKSWFFAQRFCRARFTDLATIDSFDDLNIVINQTAIGYNGPLWIGLNRSTQAQWAQQWHPFTATGIQGGQRALENVQLISTMSGMITIAQRHYILCATMVSWQIIYEQMFSLAVMVPFSFYVLVTEEKGHIIMKSNKTWRDAQTYCRSHYTDLATICSPWEQKQLIQLVGGRVYVWIGLFLDNWKSSDHWSLFARDWALGQPNATSGDCSAMMTNDTGTWSTHSCSAALPVVCYLGKSTRLLCRMKSSTNVHYLCNYLCNTLLYRRKHEKGKKHDKDQSVLQGSSKSKRPINAGNDLKTSKSLCGAL